MKKKYSEPELEIVKFSFEDLLAQPSQQSSLDSSPESGASGGDDNGEDEIP